MKRVGKYLAVISPVFAVAVAVSMLFASGYAYQAGSFSSGTVSAFRYALEEGDYAWFFWTGFMIVVCLMAGVGALAESPAIVWGCAGALLVLSGLGMMTIGVFVLPLALLLFVSAILLTAGGSEPAA